MLTLKTERVILREWNEADREPFARMNADPRVMEYLGETMSREQSDEVVDRIEAHFRAHGFGLCAAELAESGEFIGFIGLAVPTSRRRSLRASKSAGGLRLNIGARDSLRKVRAKLCVMRSKSWGWQN